TGNLKVRFGRVMELAPDGGALEARAGLGWEVADAGPAAVGVGTASLEGFTLLSDQPVIVADIRAETRFAVSSSLRDHGLVSGLSVLIQGRDRPFGTLGVFSARARPFTLDPV